MKKLKLWISIFRLRTLPLSVSGVIVGSFLAFYNGYFETVTFVLAIFATLSLQILSNIANDYGDGVKGTDNEDRIGPERAIQSGKITPEEMFEAIKINILVVIFLVFLLIYISFGSHNFLYSMLFFILGALSVFAALKYTIGESAYGYKALGDLMVFLFFGGLSRSEEHTSELQSRGLISYAVFCLKKKNTKKKKKDTKTDLAHIR